MRMAGLTWNRRNPYADGAIEDGGLSRLGRALVDELVGLGVILDLAHASPARSPRSSTGRRSPVICSHAACRAVNDHPRNLTDDQLGALADADGLFGLMLHPIAIDHEQRTIDRVVDHLEHAVDTSGSSASASVATSRPGSPGAAADAHPGRRPDAAGPRARCRDRGPEGPGGLSGAPRRARGRGWSEADIAAVTCDNLLASCAARCRAG